MKSNQRAPQNREEKFLVRLGGSKNQEKFNARQDGTYIKSTLSPGAASVHLVLKSWLIKHFTLERRCQNNCSLNLK